MHRFVNLKFISKETDGDCVFALLTAQAQTGFLWWKKVCLPVSVERQSSARGVVWLRRTQSGLVVVFSVEISRELEAMYRELA